MPVYIVTGKLGGGKSLVTVARMRDYLHQGRIVATNLDLRLHRMFGDNAKNLRVLRVPDKPTVHDLDMIGKGNESYDEGRNGLLVLDECGTWFNSRNWNDKSRKAVNDWFLHARKLGWDVMLIIQNVTILDSQARDAIAEHTVFCSRLDRLQVPYIGFLFKLFFGERLPLPRVHSARVVYGTTAADLLADRWVYRGTELFKAYDTKQLFLEDYPHGTHSLLTPWHLIGRHKKPWTWETIMRLTQIYWKRLKAPLALGAGAFGGAVLSLLAWPYLQVSLQAKAAALQTLSPAVIEAPVLAETVAGVDPFPLLDAEPAEPPPTVRQRFERYKIAAHLANGRQQYYLIQDEDGETYTDSHLRSMGLRVYYVSECELMITDAATVSDKAHVFAPGCSPRDRSRERLDLSSIPSLRQR